MNSVAQSGSTTIYGFNPISGPAIEPGMSATISGLRNQANNGTFVINSVSKGAFTVTNPIGVTAAAETGTGIALIPQTAILVVAGSY